MLEITVRKTAEDKRRGSSKEDNESETRREHGKHNRKKGKWATRRENK
jgi:hypothetical protein